jgi:hypothetical protein
MRILVITSCTGEKSVSSERALTLEDFKQGRRHVARREKELKDLLCPAESLYTGQQHVRLMRGVQAFRESRLSSNGDDVLDLQILSAGYGIVSGEARLAPYEATFQGMPKGELREWARELGIPAAFRNTVAAPYDLGLILLGDDYLSTCELDSSVEFGGLNAQTVAGPRRRAARCTVKRRG